MAFTSTIANTGTMTSWSVTFTFQTCGSPAEKVTGPSPGVDPSRFGTGTLMVDCGPQAKQPATASYGKLRLHFEANRGQTDERVKFLARGSGYGLFLTSTESVLVLRNAEGVHSRKSVAGREATTPKRSNPPEVLRIKLLGGNPHADSSDPPTSNLAVPGEVKVLRELPRLGTGKIDHRKLERMV